MKGKREVWGGMGEGTPPIHTRKPSRCLSNKALHKVPNKANHVPKPPPSDTQPRHFSSDIHPTAPSQPTHNPTPELSRNPSTSPQHPSAPPPLNTSHTHTHTHNLTPLSSIHLHLPSTPAPTIN